MDKLVQLMSDALVASAVATGTSLSMMTMVFCAAMLAIHSSIVLDGSNKLERKYQSLSGNAMWVLFTFVVMFGGIVFFGSIIIEASQYAVDACASNDKCSLYSL